MIIVFISN